MNVEVLISNNFRREAKRYIKKFRTLKEELTALQLSLMQDPNQGIKISEDVYKIRLASKSKGKGKSGGFRIINYLIQTEETEDNLAKISVILLSIYDKSETSTLSDTDISNLIEDFHHQQATEKEEEGNDVEESVVD